MSISWVSPAENATVSGTVNLVTEAIGAASVRYSIGETILGTVYNALAFGVTGDGSTDDTNALQTVFDAAASGDVVYLPTGTYMIRAGAFWDPVELELSIPAGVTIIGDGPEDSILKIIPASVTNRPFQCAVVLHSNCAIIGVGLDGSADAVNRAGFGSVMFHGWRVEPWAEDTILFDNVHAYNILASGQESFGFMLNGAHDVIYRNVVAYNVEGSGIHIDGEFLNQRRAANVLLENCVAHGNHWAGISVYAAEDVILRNCVTYNNGTQDNASGIGSNGLNVEWSQRVTFEDCETFGNGLSGVGTWGENEDVTLRRVHTYNNGQWDFVNTIGNGEIGWRVGNYHLGDPVPRGITQSMTIEDCTIGLSLAMPHHISVYDDEEPVDFDAWLDARLTVTNSGESAYTTVFHEQWIGENDAAWPNPPWGIDADNGTVDIQGNRGRMVGDENYQIVYATQFVSEFAAPYRQRGRIELASGDGEQWPASRYLYDFFAGDGYLFEIVPHENELRMLRNTAFSPATIAVVGDIGFSDAVTEWEYEILVTVAGSDQRHQFWIWPEGGAGKPSTPLIDEIENTHTDGGGVGYRLASGASARTVYHHDLRVDQFGWRSAFFEVV